MWKNIVGLLPGIREFIAPALPWLIAGAMLTAFSGGYYVRDRIAKAALVDAVQKARETERNAMELALKAEWSAQDAARIREREAHGKIRTLQRRLANAPRCDVPVPDDWVRKRADLPTTAAAAAGTGPSAARVEPDQPAGLRGADGPVTDARVAVANCERNRLENFDAEVAERKALREFYHALVKRYGGGP